MERAIEKANFGNGPKEIIQNKEAGEKGAHFAASVEFFTVKCDGKFFKVVGKVQPKEAYIRQMMQSDNQFITEVMMYQKLLPFLGVQDLFPVLYYGEANKDPDLDVVLLEDMGVDGFKVTKERLFLSIEHLRLAVKALGRFHAASFAAKNSDKDRFQKLVSLLKFERATNCESKESIDLCLTRGVKPHLEKYGDILEPALKEMCKESFWDLLVAPSEPWAVVCHGDFCRNNIMFKYEGDTPIAVKFFDLQTSRYGSPAIDLSFLLYLNTDKATRDLHWDSLLQDYLSSFKKHLPPGITVNDEEFYDDFSKRAVYGYYHCSFFKPMMNEEKTLDMSEYAKFTPEERVEWTITVGGERGTELIADIVLHLVEKKYIHKFLELAQGTNQ